MSGTGPRNQYGCQRLARLAWVLLVVVAIADGPLARADPPPSPYFGAFWAVQLHGGAAWRTAADGDPPGPLTGVSVRAATLMSLVDVQLTFLTSRYAASARDSDVDVARYSLGLEARLHPFFMQHLHGTHLAYWIASIHLTLGAGLDIVDATGPPGARVDEAFGWLIGLGSDIPLGDVDHDWGLWLGVGYQLRFVEADTGVRGLSNFDEHTFLLTLGYRNNDIRFTRIPRPGELNDLEPPRR